MKAYNRFPQKETRRSNRKEMPGPEVILWSRLKDKQLLGLKFRRQYSFGPYIVDFYCARQKLAIEIDGESHFTGNAPEYDEKRQDYIAQFGVRFLRFTNRHVMDNLEGVLTGIAEAAGYSE